MGNMNGDHGFPKHPDLDSPSPNDEQALIDIDRSYAGMYDLHATAHKGLIAEIAEARADKPGSSLLEVACGTGWNTKAFIDAGFDYWGLDLSENAIHVLLRRYPEARILNCEIDEADIIAGGAFNTVYCASMLEHVGDHERALAQLIRIAGSDLYVLFYEGLTEGPDVFEHSAFDNPHWRHFHGKKFLAYQDRHKGYFMKRYNRQTITNLVRATGHDFEILDGTNRRFLSKETVLHVRKEK